MNSLFRSPTPSVLTKRTVRQNAPQVRESNLEPNPQGLFDLSKLGRLLALLGANQNPMEQR